MHLLFQGQESPEVLLMDPENEHTGGLYISFACGYDSQGTKSI